MSRRKPITESVKPAAFVPAAVQNYVSEFGVEPDAARLLTDPRAESVWREVSRRKLIWIRAYDQSVFLTLQKFENMSSADMSCVVFLDRINWICRQSTPMTRVEADARIEPYRSAAALLGELQGGAAAAFDPDLREAFAKVRGYLERRAANEEENLGELVVDRSNVVRGKDDKTRVIGRRVVATFRESYEKPMFPVAAAVVSILTGQEVTKDDLKNY
jgi:hypothetical protein